MMTMLRAQRFSLSNRQLIGANLSDSDKENKSMKNIALACMCMLLVGCSTYNDPIANSLASGRINSATQLADEFKKDKNLPLAAEQLASDYFEGQSHGESIIDASKKFGEGVKSFYSVEEYRVEDIGIYKRFVGYVFGGYEANLAVYVRAKTGNQMGGIVWKDYAVLLSYYKELQSQNDKYRGLRIKGVEETELVQ